jgi:3-dehydroquinate synthase
MVEVYEDRVRISLPGKDTSYDLISGVDLFPQIAEEIEVLLPGVSRYAVISDRNVMPLYGSKVSALLKAKGLRVDEITPFEAGEWSKTRDMKKILEDEMLDLGMGRDTAILAVGGGVVTDIAGYTAATYNRGIPVVQIPTTLLAMVDASVGGKTGVNTMHGKNLIGAFYQPSRVYMDVGTLITLPPREHRNGLGEVSKHGVIKDRRLFEYLEENALLILDMSPEDLHYIVMESCRIKGEVVERDEREGGERQILNGGHTLAHPIETLSEHEITHGEAVSIGLVVDCYIANEVTGFPLSSLDRLKNLHLSLGLPITIPEEITDEDLMKAILYDKKVRKGRPRFPLAKDLGVMHDFGGAYTTPLDDDVILRGIQKAR